VPHLRRPFAASRSKSWIRKAVGPPAGNGARSSSAATTGPSRVYYKDHEKTVRHSGRTWMVHTGDLGSMDDGGRIIYLGRIKDMLKVAV